MFCMSRCKCHLSWGIVWVDLIIFDKVIYVKTCLHEEVHLIPKFITLRQDFIVLLIRTSLHCSWYLVSLTIQNSTLPKHFVIDDFFLPSEGNNVI